MNVISFQQVGAKRPAKIDVFCAVDPRQEDQDAVSVTGIDDSLDGIVIFLEQCRGRAHVTAAHGLENLQCGRMRGKTVDHGIDFKLVQSADAFAGELQVLGDLGQPEGNDQAPYGHILAAALAVQPAGIFTIVQGRGGLRNDDVRFRLFQMHPFQCLEACFDHPAIQGSTHVCHGGQLAQALVGDYLSGGCFQVATQQIGLAAGKVRLQQGMKARHQQIVIDGLFHQAHQFDVLFLYILGHGDSLKNIRSKNQPVVTARHAKG